MSALMQVHLKGPVVLIGSDCPEISPNIIEYAFSSLNTNDVVIGHALDGGFYLIGLNKLPNGMFKNIDWGSSTVLPILLNNLGQLKVFQLPALSDLDNINDFKKFEKEYLNHEKKKFIIVETEN